MKPITNVHGEHYLESSVRTSSPARLRLMLIERAVEVAANLAKRYRAKEGQGDGVNEDSIRLLDLLTELLSGVTDKESEVCAKVADLYVFLSQHLIRAEEAQDADAIDEIGLVLQTEAETWRMACAQEVSSSGGVGTPTATTTTEVAAGIDFSG